MCTGRIVRCWRVQAEAAAVVKAAAEADVAADGGGGGSTGAEDAQ